MGDLSNYNLADIWEAVAERVADRVAVICGERRLTYAELESRANRLAHHLLSVGVAAGDHVGLYLMNGTEYLEGMLAAFKIRAVPINVNFRYVADELRYLFDDSGIVALIHNPEFADRVAEAAPSVPAIRHTLATGADYEAALAAQPADRGFPERSGDDPYIIYTGGTTGMPKGVVWRQEDAFFACVGGGDPMRLQGPVEQPSEILDRIIDFEFCAYPLAPLIHAAAQWTTLSWLYCGARVVLTPGSFDPSAVWATVARENVNTLIMVGDAMARPLVDDWEANGPYEVSSLYALGSGGAPLSAYLKDRFHEMMPDAMITDGFGSSETGAQGSQRIQPGVESKGLTSFQRLGTGTTVLAEDGTEVQPGSGVIGRLALSGRIPLGYHNDPAKTAETFVEVDGRRWVITGDMATVEEDGAITLFGRGSVSINTGGEKVYPEEVESALKSHPDVYDAVVVGVADPRWGEVVCAVIQPVAGASVRLDDLVAHARSSIAGYKVPRRLVVVPEVVRSPVGKADYRWAKTVASEGDAS
ncbi:MAG: acyl-CoA synthetase [Microthrixaceae bacterium]|nr:acyl-CoA synthetase [Microthrixaceae bacterium]